MIRSLLPLALALSAIAGLAPAQTKLLRFPDIHGDTVVFCHGGDLWRASAKGGRATRLTAHPGLELFPRFSPDGRWIAFTGQYDGDEQVYVIPAEGGEPKQLTFYPARGPLPPRWGYDNQVYDWTADGKAILVRSHRDGWDLTDCRLWLVPLEGGLPRVLPMPVAGAGDLSPDGKKVVYAPLFRDFRTWKRYEGGWASDLWIFDLATNEAKNITEHPRTDRDPMWIGDAVWFVSDRSGTLNLYRFDPGTNETRQVTKSTEADVRWPGDDGRGRIVYELAGELVVHDCASGNANKLSIEVPHDGLQTRPEWADASKNIEGVSLSPDGKRVLFVARGEVFDAPTKKGRTRNLSRTPGAHERAAAWSPDGRRIAFLSDRTGEEEVWMVGHDGGEATQLTDDGDGMRYGLRWNPDSKRLAFSDKEGRIWVLDVESKKKTRIADEPQGRSADYKWSPCGGHLAFSLTDPNDFRSLYIHTLAEAKTRRITGELFNEMAPAWSPDGDYLYFWSDRSFVPQIGAQEWNYALDRETGLFVLALRKDVKHPFPPEEDEVAISDDSEDVENEKKNEKKDGKKEKKGDDEGREPLRIDFDGLGQRVARVPIPADNYYGLSVLDDHLIYVRGGPFYYGRSSDIKPSIRFYDLKKRKESTFMEGSGSYSLSADRKKLLLAKGGAYHLHDAKPGGKAKGQKIGTGGLRVERDPRREWAAIFDEVWRRFRDFFYVENMHGYDWAAIGKRYRALLPHVAHRSDLNYVLGEMIAELNISHAYVSGGDWDQPTRHPVALLGADLELDAASGRYRIARILGGDNAEDRYRSPLTEIGVAVNEGDYILAIDGQPLRAPQNPYRLLRHRTGGRLHLRVNSEPKDEGARDVTINPITSETSLRYLAWIERNRKQVHDATDGRVGYLHIPDMGANGIREFIKWYYGQIRKEGLVVDVRGNGGGNVSQMIIERLGRRLLGTRFSRTQDFPGTYPNAVFHGHMVCLLSETSASDGDIFPARFKKAGLGPLIGKRSWGGVIGITSHGPLLDGGGVNVPQFGTNDADGSWTIEGYGVAPDIEVDNTPASVIAGRDLQLEAGIEEVMRRMKANRRRLPARPKDPVKTN